MLLEKITICRKSRVDESAEGLAGLFCRGERERERDTRQRLV